MAQLERETAEAADLEQLRQDYEARQKAAGSRWWDVVHVAGPVAGCYCRLGGGDVQRGLGGEAMKTIEEQLILHEGLRLKPYRDTVGKLTIGVGRNLDDVGITRAEAFFCWRTISRPSPASLKSMAGTSCWIQ